MSSRAGINIYARLQMQQAGTVRDEAKGIQLSLDNISENFAQLPQKQKELSNVLGTSLSLVTTLQLARFGITDIIQLASGKGGIQDVLSLATTSIIMIYRVNMLLQNQIALQHALNAAKAIGMMLGLTYGGPMLGLLAAGAVVGGYQLYAGWQQAQRAPELEQQRLRELAYKTIMGDQRQRLQEYRSLTGQ
jgi:hypothetical protein